MQVLDRYFGNVCELDLIFNFHKAYYILDELLIAGTCKHRALSQCMLSIAQYDLFSCSRLCFITNSMLRKLIKWHLCFPIHAACSVRQHRHQIDATSAWPLTSPSTHTVLCQTASHHRFISHFYQSHILAPHHPTPQPHTPAAGELQEPNKKAISKAISDQVGRAAHTRLCVSAVVLGGVLGCIKTSRCTFRAFCQWLQFIESLHHVI